MRKLQVGDISEVTYGPPVAMRREENPLRLQKNRNYYHFIYVEKILYEEPVPSFAEVKDSIREWLLKERKEKAWQEWLKSKIREAKIEVFDDRYKDVLDLLEKGPI